MACGADRLLLNLSVEHEVDLYIIVNAVRCHMYGIDEIAKSAGCTVHAGHYTSSFAERRMHALAALLSATAETTQCSVRDSNGNCYYTQLHRWLTAVVMALLLQQRCFT
jgi:hypothetical protein